MGRRKGEGHNVRTPEMAGPETGYGYCPSGKRGYPTKRRAKQADKAANRPGRRYYRCADCAVIHSTTLPYMEQVACGYIEADQ